MTLIQANLNLIYVVGGLIALFLGGECLIRGAIAISDKLGIPKLVIGLTVVGFGTSMPELMVGLQAVERGAPDVAMGNVVGSNTANVLLIAGLGALISPLNTRAPGLRRDVIVMVLASAAIFWLALKGVISIQSGFALTGALAFYLLLVFFQQRKMPANQVVQNVAIKPMSIPVATFLTGAGLIMLVLGADYLVRGATAIATSMGVSQAVIGLTLVAVGTSLPELTVSIMSAVKGENEVSLGNVIGSNIFNLLGILGIIAIVHPLTISPAFLDVDMIVMIAASVGLAVLVFVTPKIGRFAGFIFVIAYAVYMTWLAFGAEGFESIWHDLYAKIGGGG